MNEHFLKLNPNKTEIIIFTPDSSSKLIGLVHPSIGHITFKNSVKLLGVNLDDILSFESHVNSLTSSCYYHLRYIGQLKHKLSREDLKILTQSVISSKLDYCNVILFGINDGLIKQLQKVQNAAARLINKLPKHSSVTKAIEDLHWLRVKERCVYKILLIVYKHFSCTSPNFLDSFLETSNLETRKLKLTYYNTKHGRRAFSYTAPRMWNKLPEQMRTEESIVTFKKNLKTHLFTTRTAREIINAICPYTEQQHNL